MKKYIIAEVYLSVTAFNVKFLTDSEERAKIALNMFRAENPDDNFALLEVIG